MSAWICACHCSGFTKPGVASIARISSELAALRRSLSSGLLAGTPSLHSQARMMSPPGRTMRAAALMPFTP